MSCQHKQHPRRSKLKTELEYFRNNRAQMKYSEHLSHNLLAVTYCGKVIKTGMNNVIPFPGQKTG